MKIVLDTNVLVAAFIARGTCAELLEYCIRGHELFSSDYILGELQDVLTNKFSLPPEEVEPAVSLIRKHFTIVSPALLDGPPDSIDADDLPILGTALAAKCRCLITGDKALLRLKQFRSMDVIAPNEFWGYERSPIKA